MDERNIQKLAGFIKDSGSTVFFGGAGVSTESGMKDYRSEDGLYNTVKQYGVSPETILSRSFFEAHTDVFYDFYYKYFLNSEAEPNRAHFALTELEKAGKLKAIITQNIDGLHQRSGSVNVIELHGTVYKNHCVACGEAMPVERIKALCGRVPRCEKCGGIVKPDVVLYEEPLDERVVRSAVNAISTADLLIIGGTSLAVYPAASYIGYFQGDNVVIINRGETQFDSSAALTFSDSIGEVLSETVKML